MKQQTFADMEYSNRKRKTRREQFLNSMEVLIPWAEWVELIRPYYPSGKRGRKPRGIEIMLRMYLMQTWFGLSSEGIEDAVYDSYSMRSFLRLDFFHEQVPDATTLLKFRHLLNEHGLREQIFTDLSERLKKEGLILHEGMVVDASLTAAPAFARSQHRKDAEISV